MKYVAGVILIGFLGVAFLGVMPMNHNSHHTMNGDESPCPIATMFNIVCVADAASMALIHIGALQSFLSTPVSTSLTLITLLLIAGFLFAVLKWSDPKALLLFERVDLSHSNIFILVSEKERSWLALFENSPSFA